MKTSIKLYTNAGFSGGHFNGSDYHNGEVSVIHSGASCEKHAPKRNSPLWKRQNWRAVTPKEARSMCCGECAHNKRQDELAADRAECAANQTPNIDPRSLRGDY